MIRKSVKRAVLGVVLACLASIMAGCGCTSSYWESFATLGIGYQYCGKNINGSRCLTPQGRNEKGCACNKESACMSAKKVGAADKGCCCAGE